MSVPLLNKTGLGIMASMALPVGYMAYRQVAGLPNREEKMRGGFKRVGFWGGLVATAMMGLKVAAPLFTSGKNLAGLCVLAVASTLPVVGYEAFKRIGNWFYPNAASNSANSTESGLAPQAVPADIISNQIGNVTESGSVMPGGNRLSPQWNGQQVPPPMPTPSPYDRVASSYGPYAPSYPPTYSQAAYTMPADPTYAYGQMPSGVPFLPPPSSFLPSYYPSAYPMMRPY